MEKYVIVDRYFDGYKWENNSTIFKVKNGIIAEKYTANKQDMENIMESGNEVLDLRGKFVTPGLIDSHDHFMLTSLKLKYQVDFSGVRSFEDFRRVLEENRNKIVHGWFQGYGINEYNMKEKRLPDIKIIDEIMGNTPVFITQMTEHYGICNSRSLEIAGIDRNTADPANGKLGRNSDGNPDGVLYEANAMDMVKSRIPEYTLDDYIEAIISGSEMYRKAGLSTVKDIGGTGNDVNEETRICALNRISKEGNHKIRIAVALPVYSLKDVSRKIELASILEENQHIMFAGFKMFLDGSILSRTAWMKHSYVGSKGNMGIPLWDIKNFREGLKQLSATGHHISIHTIGDRAIETALDSIEELKNSGVASRYALVHCYKLEEKTIEKIKKLNVGVETQLAFVYFIGDSLSDNIGLDQSKCLFPAKTMVEKGIRVSNGSDSPVTPFDPLYGIYSSVFRKTLTGKNSSVYSNNESLTIEETVKTYTSESAAVIGWNEIGSLETGKFSDFTVWDPDPATAGKNIEDYLHINLKSITL